ncbi:L-lactate dehydrogenase (quinone) large subunit LdhH [Anaeromyxobacter oryzae]|uniref:(Fe-S)-binding protein n=1 Tax=Anaeromyxobacter oryzae TaxID=2918170 RepID=A0ABM7WRF1_9BACT|nr:LUD domain-containing protein [Anaeromyxobacter oryzae]BDG02058.1 (Fe-S)-binding protein [Anaeromyxobacter oryzae]
MSPSDFRRRLDAALADGQLGDALGRFADAYLASRARAYEGLEFEAVRDRVVAVKSRAAAKLDALADRFEEEATRAGAKVLRASDPDAIREHVLRLCRERGVSRVVKSKSMATEELHLNAALSAAGVRVRETDLGEWIVQLAGQRPSHMVMPAIHMSKEQVAEVFSKEVDERLAADIPSLVAVARRELREEFLRADMGITGANVAVAETGSLVLLTNEGNARLVTTLPRIHLAVVGVEKLVERLSDVEPIVRALPRSATGQLLTSYLSMITGPAPGPDGAPKELHVVLMDHRRTEMARDPRFAQALRCIRCASCVNVCPVYRLVGGHVFGGVYTGGIGTILAAWFDGLRASSDIQALCVGCRRCTEVCPARIDIPELVVELRRRIVREDGQPLAQRAALGLVSNRRAFHAALRAASVAQRPFAKGGLIRHLPLFLGGLTEHRALPAIATVPLRDRLAARRRPPEAPPEPPRAPAEAPAPDGRRGERVALFSGCLVDFAYPEIGEAVVKVLERAGLEVVFPEGQTCCGVPARQAGATGVAARNAKDNVVAFEDAGADHVVSACPTCTAALRREMAETLRAEGEPEWAARAESLGRRVRDFSTLVRQLVDEGRLALEPGADLPAVTYHDSCHMKRTLGVRDAPRELLRAAGHAVAEMAESDACCGMGGSYTLKFPEISRPILARKLERIRETGAATVAMDCPGCLLQIRGGLARAGDPVAARHTAELVAARLGDPAGGA